MNKMIWGLILTLSGAIIFGYYNNTEESSRQSRAELVVVPKKKEVFKASLRETSRHRKVVVKEVSDSDITHLSINNLFSWPTAKVIYSLESIIRNSRVTFDFVNEILSFPIHLESYTEEDHHHSVLEEKFLVKNIALNEFAKKVQARKVSSEDMRKFKLKLEEIAQETADLLMVRDALSILKESYGYKPVELSRLVELRESKDQFAYRDLLI